MPMSVEERVAKASAAHARNAQRRRFQRYVREMRAAGHMVVIKTEDGNGRMVVDPDYATVGL